MPLCPSRGAPRGACHSFVFKVRRGTDKPRQLRPAFFYYEKGSVSSTFLLSWVWSLWHGIATWNMREKSADQTAQNRGGSRQRFSAWQHAVGQVQDRAGGCACAPP